LKPKMFINSLTVHFCKSKALSEELQAAKDCYGIDDDSNLFHYLGWIPRFFELFSKIRSTRKMIDSIHLPCVACQSMLDEMVAKSSADILEKNAAISVIKLKSSGHYYYPGEDFEIIEKAFKEFLP